MAGKKARSEETSGGKVVKTPASLVDKAYQQIKRMMFYNELAAGQRLRYQDIAGKLRMSQTPVIMALTRLENEGLVHSEAHKGFYVPDANLDDVKELYEMRGLIEGFLVRKTAEIISEDQLEQLRGLMAEHEGVRGLAYTRERLWCDARLHIALASFSGHRIGERFLRQVFDRLYLMYRPERLAMERMREAEKEHKEVYDALAAGDGEQACEIIRKHIQNGRKHILEGLEKEVRRRDSFILWN
ncbi:MAG: GntR family transcriptional regulator [Deltaproteobacteria bacterium]|nr:GntR family transcriptional regulator [Deltaproteobacteria bacterium]